MTVSFHSVRLPENVEQGAQGGPEFNTSIAELSNGSEQRNINWSIVRPSWDISYGIQTKADIDEVLQFFYARNGRAYGFRFKDWSDFEIETAQSIGTGDGANKNFQIYKRYSSGGFNFDRKLTRIVTGTDLVYVNGVLKTNGVDYTLPVDTGIIAFTAAPANGTNVTLTCEFDVPVRFDIDKLAVKMTWEDALEVPSIPIITLKE